MSSLGALAIGKIVGLHGLKGEVKFLPYAGVDEFPWLSVLFQSDLRLKEYEVLRARRNKSFFLLTVDGFTSRESSEQLVGSEVFIEKSKLPETEPGEYYLFELVGLDVYSEEGERVGPVTGIMPAGGNDLLVIAGASGEVLIPAIEEFIIEVDKANGKIVVRLLEGFLQGEEKAP